MVAVEVQAAQVSEAEVAKRGVNFVGISGSGWKRIRLNRKNPAHLVGHSMHARPRVWKRLHFSGFIGVSRGGAISMIWVVVLFIPGPEWVHFFLGCAGPRLQVCMIGIGFQPAGARHAECTYTRI